MRTFIAFAILALALLTFAQVACDYSCSEKDENGWALATDPSALGYNSAFSIFECIYGAVNNADSEGGRHTCHYYKNNGERAIGHASDACPQHAVKCSEVDSPKFSAQGEYEIPPWIEHGRYSMYLLAHPLPG